MSLESGGQDVKRVKTTEGNDLYRETVPFPFMTLLTGFMAGLAGLFLFVLLYQLLVAPRKEYPPIPVALVMALVFLGAAWVVAQARRLNLRLTPESVTVAFGRFKHTVPWGSIQGVRRDSNPGIAYGGWGIRIARVNGKWTLVYNTIASPRVMLELNRGKFRQFAFSTRHPDEVVEIVGQQMRAGRIKE